MITSLCIWGVTRALRIQVLDLTHHSLEWLHTNHGNCMGWLPPKLPLIMVDKIFVVLDSKQSFSNLISFWEDSVSSL